MGAKQSVGTLAAMGVLLVGCAASLVPAAPPTPFRCVGPQAPFSRGIIGRGGGSVRLQGHELFVPAGILDRDYTFVLRPEQTAEVRVHVEVEGLNTFNFRGPARLTLSYDRCDDQPPRDLRIYRRTADGGWQNLNGRVVPGQRAVVTPLRGLSLFELGVP